MQESFISICLRVDEVGERVAGVERDGGGREQGETEFHFRFCWVVVGCCTIAVQLNISKRRRTFN